MEIEVRCDLRSQFGGARDQDQRPTCLAFAASDAHASLRSPWAPLSVEFAFGSRSPHVGATLPAMLESVREDGQPIEGAWPYLAAVPAVESNWKPPNGIHPLYRRDGKIGGDSVGEIVKWLDNGKPVLVLLMLSAAFDLVGKAAIIDQVPGERPAPNRRHAVIAVGYGLLRAGRAILVRNSWGEQWGDKGYAWLTEAYLEPRMFRVGILTEDVTDVPSGSATA